MLDRRDQAGFSLVEILAGVALTAILMTLGAFAIRHYWFVRSLQGAQDEVVSQLRRQQQRSVAESHPRIYGARFPGGTDAATWGLLRVQLATSTAPATCVEYETRRFDAGVRVFNPSATADTAFAAASPETELCRSSTGAGADDEFVFFDARGTATPGRVTVRHPVLARRKVVCVYGLTGRVEARESSCS